MIIILLIITGLFIISALKPSNIKIKTVRELADIVFEKNNRDKQYFNISMVVAYTMVYIYTITVALVVRDLLFIGVTVLYIAWSAMDYTTIYNYINKQETHKTLDSKFYKYGSKVLDLMYFGYVIYALVLKL